MGTQLIRKYARTNIFIIDQDLWNWAQYKAKSIGKASVSEYIFELISIDKESEIIKK